VLNAASLLELVKSYLVQYNNIGIGSHNTVDGDNITVIGSSNSLTGSNDWVFDSEFESTNPQNGVLIIQSYLIEVPDIMLITTRAQNVIHCIDQI
jgi:hypothetical protein